MAKQVMIRDDIAERLKDMKEMKKCSYTRVIEDLLENKKGVQYAHPEDVLSLMKTFVESMDRLRIFNTKEARAHGSNGSLSFLRENPEYFSLLREALINYFKCVDAFNHCDVSDDFIEKNDDDFQLYMICLGSLYIDTVYVLDIDPLLLFPSGVDEEIRDIADHILELPKRKTPPDESYLD